MSTLPDFAVDRVWTPDDLVDLPEEIDWRRFEIVDGALVVSPHATPRHDLLAAELIAAVRGAIPMGYRIIGSAMIDLRPSYRIPDVLVLADSAFCSGASALVAPSNVLLAVKIESHGSVTTDRITKPAQYAAAGIAHYWRVEMDPLGLHTYRLAGQTYADTGDWSTGAIAHIADPFPVSIDVGSLLPL